MFSLLDNDFYSFTVMQVILHHFPSTEVEYKFICRNEADLLPLKEKIERKIDLLCEARFTKEELDYLRSIRFLKKDFIDFLEDFTLKRRLVNVYEKEGKLQISVKGDWLQTILFEIPILSIVSEAYCCDRIIGSNALDIGRENLQRKIDFLNRQDQQFYFADFGTRRRFSKSWQDEVVGTLRKSFPTHFYGTSNCLLAKKYSSQNHLEPFVPVGTMSHQYISAGMGIANVQLKNSQKFMLETWALEFRGELGVALTDTLNMDIFLNDFDKYLALLFSGCRQDSGDPFVWGNKLIGHYKKLGIDPMTKIAVFSDNLNFEKAYDIYEYFKNKIKMSFGIGTFLQNDVGIKPLSIVMKMIYCNGQPVAKISDTPDKIVCEDADFLSYLKNVYKL